MTIKGDQNGIAVDKIALHLSTEAQSAFREAIQLMVNEPDNLKRNDKYSDILDAFDSTGYIHPKWRDSFDQVVALEGYSEESMDELTSIKLRISKRGRNGYTEIGVMFSGYNHIAFESGRSIYFLYFSGYIMPDGKIALMSPEDHDKWYEYVLDDEEVEENV